MRYGLLPGVVPPVSRIVLGTSGMRSYDAAAPLLDAFAEHGGTFLDTAHVYAGGASEPVVGRWLRSASHHRGVAVVGKGAHPPDCRPDRVEPQLLESLERLGIPRMDLYLLHRDDADVPASEWVDAVGRQLTAGRAGAWGVSNWTVARVDEATAVAAAAGIPPPVAVSNHLSLAGMEVPLHPGGRGVSAADAAWFTTRQVALLPWSSQARGFFSTVDPARLDPGMTRSWDTPTNRARRDRAAALAARFGVPTINVALAYVLAQPFPTFPLIGPRTVGELTVALGGLAVDLTAEQVRWLADGEPVTPR